MLVLLLLALAASAPLLDGEASVLRVVDGDTIVVDLRPASRFSALAGEQRIRLADINAPELSTQEGRASAEALRGLLHGRIVYVDIDDKGVKDRHGRIVAIVFLKYNETHLLNVNKWLVENGYAQIWDHENEFDPRTWTLYVRVEGGSEDRQELLRYAAVVVAVILLALMAAVVARR